MRFGVARFGVSKMALPLALVLLGACGGRTLDQDAYNVYGQPSPPGAGNGASAGAISSGGAASSGTQSGGAEVGGSAPLGEAGGPPGGAHSVGGGPAQDCGVTPHSNGSLTLIDDMEEHQGFINQYEGRKGAWFAFNDGTPGSTQFPTPGMSPFPMRQVSSDATGGHYVAYCTGSNAMTWGAGIGAELNDGCPYDASVYNGLHFFARGEAGDALSVRVPTANAYTGFDSTCSSSETPCSDVFQTEIALAPYWQEYYVAFDGLRPFDHASPARFDAAELLRIEFEAPPESFFSFSIDGLTFF